VSAGSSAAACLAIAVFVVATVSSASAHEVRPAYLGITEVERDTFDITWKQPALREKRLPLDPVFPSQCAITVPMLDEVIPGAIIRTWRIQCAAGALENRGITIAGLSGSLTDVWVVMHPANTGARKISVRLTASQPSFHPSQNAGIDLSSYFSLGTKHLLSGVDHILFVIGLMFFVSGFPSLLKTITAFTVAHSITLAASTLKSIHLPQAPVEASIMLSILFLAVEASAPNRSRTLTARMPWLIAFVFGLLHGFGFAGALQDIGLPVGATAAALLLFNLGIEFGQVVVIVFLLGLQYCLSGFAARIPPWLFRIPVYAMGSLSSYWLLQRVWVD